ncbi:MAG: maleylpyruvate isomerase N-terminal domain-containing protein [Chloroflexota bacterium]
MTSAAIRAALADAANHLVMLAAAVPAGAWSNPGLGEWTVRDLTGHAARGLLTIEQYLESAASGKPEIASPASYFLKALASGDKATLNANVAQRGREAGAALGADPAAEVRSIAARVLQKVESAPDDTVFPTAAGTMRLIDYLPTRIFELTIHSLDLAAALASPDQPPRSALAVTLDLASKLALEQSRAGDALLALTGRRHLPDGYSIL